MNLRDLEYAVCLAGEGQFRRAAARCHVSQPTLSAQIAKLEDELGVQLFERGPRAATPTVNGRSLLRQAQVVLDEVERLRALARAGQDPLQGPFISARSRRPALICCRFCCRRCEKDGPSCNCC